MDFKSFQNTDPYNKYRDPEVLSQVNNLSKMNDNELFSELSKQVAIKQKNGTMGDIDKLAKTITPFLNPEQKKRLDTILKSIKG
ncbi:MAG: hypothetical protein LBQ05_00715 [Christensenellaceae bacterium]|jgi:hypothetical protein|nr:hypothetical protein [Christensenellaceae bacterium]